MHIVEWRELPCIGFTSLTCTTGANAAILHYETNMSRVREGDLVLVDAGAEHRGYTADISRTFPASPTFSAAQRDVYDAVLAAQVGPGAEGEG